MAIDMTNLLSDASLSISLMVLREKTSQDELLNERIPVFYLKRKSKFNIKYLFKLSIVKRHEIVHVHMRHTFLYVQLVVKLFKINSKVILHDHFGGINKDDRVPFSQLFFETCLLHRCLKTTDRLEQESIESRRYRHCFFIK